MTSKTLNIIVIEIKCEILEPNILAQNFDNSSFESKQPNSCFLGIIQGKFHNPRNQIKGHLRIIQWNVKIGKLFRRFFQPILRRSNGWKVEFVMLEYVVRFLLFSSKFGQENRLGLSYNLKSTYMWGFGISNLKYRTKHSYFRGIQSSLTRWWVSLTQHILIWLCSESLLSAVPLVLNHWRTPKLFFRIGKPKSLVAIDVDSGMTDAMGTWVTTTWRHRNLWQ